jgi:ATP-dependent Clp protease ATP-binding subunit ClpC
MKKTNDISYTQEYQDVYGYMVDVLQTEFPIGELIPSHLIMSILDNEECHASLLLNNVLGKDTVNFLKDHFNKRLTEESKKGRITKSKKLNRQLTDIIVQANKEIEACKSHNLGTEHLLLAFLNPNLKIEERLIFDESGLFYDTLIKQCEGIFCPEKENKADIPTYDDNDIVSKKNGGQMHAYGEVESLPLQDGKIPSKSLMGQSLTMSNESTPNIDKYTINLHKEIENGKYDKLVGKENIINDIIKVLSRRRKNNVVLVGKPGVGKTSIGYKLAEMIDSGNVPYMLEGKKVVMLDVMALVSGTHLRGMLEERIDGLFKELKANSKYILFIDDMQNIVRNTGKDKDGDLSDVIGNILSGGEVRVVGTISFKDYRNGIENNSVLATKLQKIVVEPSSIEETFNILKENKHYYENFHHVKFSDDIITKTIKLAKRYITNNNLPDSAIDVLDITGASISLNNKQSNTLKELKEKLSTLANEKRVSMNSGDFERVDEISKIESSIQKELSDNKKSIDNDDSTWTYATEDDINDTVSSITNIPISKLKESDKSTIINIDKILKKDIIGQDEAIDEIAKAIKRAKAGFNDKSRVLSSFLLVGSTGVGKTLIAKKLAENIYGDEKALVRFDMSEYQDKATVNKLIGSPNGYVGYDEGGLLTEAIKNKPYCVLLFDEIEKADESIYNLFLQLLDEGTLTDNNGVKVNFKNVIVIMTSNVGARQASEIGGGLGFVDDTEDKKKNIIDKSIRSQFNPEFINRIDKIIHFNPLTDENLKKISEIELNKVCDRVKENGVTINYDESVVEYVYAEAIKQKEYGARPIMRIIQDSISDKVVDYVLLSNDENKQFNVSAKDNEEIVVNRE